jgi:hypothetical protein
MTVYRESVKGRARVLRQEGASIRVIAGTLGVPKSTVGNWLRDSAAEPQYVKTCWCGTPFLAHRSHAMSCSESHRNKRPTIFGAVQRTGEKAA